MRVDFEANARSMGCDATTATTPAELQQALLAARDGNRTTVIVCPTSPDRPLLASGAFWDLGVPQAATDQTTLDHAAAHLARSTEQRHY